LVIAVSEDQARLVHHTLGNSEFDLFHKMAEPVVCARTIMTPDNCVVETERLITEALYHRRGKHGIPWGLREHDGYRQSRPGCRAPN
jgi:TPP-dependent 2-oxoacid decarboxylase